MKIYKNTNTLDKYLPQLEYTENKAEAEVMIVGGKKFELNEFPKLKGVFKTGVGTDNLPFEEANKVGVKIVLPSSETCNIIFEETADFSCYLILTGLYANEGNWNSWKKDDRRMLHNKKLLVIGTGNIGKKVADKMAVFMQVDTYDSLKDAVEILEQKIKQADAVSLHIPLSNQTKDFFDAQKLSWLKDGALLVNTARGPVINEQSLYEELKKRRIKAALDVFWEEPYKGVLNEISSTHFIKTPHIASTCAEFLEGAANDFLKLVSTF
jgi:lactate dehydrogenase-like 2-hydroxyacid dehydrogenase